jgi:oligosaccharide repeat unit polymerase
LCNVGLICFYVGYRSSGGKRLARAIPALGDNWSRRRVVLLASIMLPMAIAAFLYLVESFGGISAWTSQIGAARTEGIHNNGYEFFVAYYFPTIPALLFYAEFLKRRKRVDLLLCIACLVAALTIGALLGYKVFIVFPVLQTLCLHNYLAKRIKIRAKAVAAIVSGVVFLVLYNFFRSLSFANMDAETLRTIAGSTELWKDVSLLFFGRFTGIETVTLVIHRTVGVLPSWGLDSAEYLLTGFIPRAIWPDKIVPLQGFLQAVYQRTDVGANPTLIGELYWDCRLPGVALGLYILGKLCRVSYEFIQIHRGRSAIVLYSVTLMFMLLIIEAPTVHCATFLVCFTSTLIGLTFVCKRLPAMRSAGAR